MAKRAAPEVNAGSMADIAFLLLIFFLVTTTIASDTGINRKLPPKFDKENITPPKIKEKNLFTVIVNKNNQLLVEDQNMELKDLREAAIAFLDNGGAQKGNEDQTKYCAYCRGDRSPESSDNPDKAVISVQNSRQTNYGTYIGIQNELVAAYAFLRNREGKRLYGETYASMKERHKDINDLEDKDELKAKMDEVKSLFPEKISEAEASE